LHVSTAGRILNHGRHKNQIWLFCAINWQSIVFDGMIDRHRWYSIKCALFVAQVLQVNKPKRKRVENRLSTCPITILFRLAGDDLNHLAIGSESNLEQETKVPPTGSPTNHKKTPN